jgi:ABC-type uncharacterized transport system permease subunit
MKIIGTLSILLSILTLVMLLRYLLKQADQSVSSTVSSKSSFLIPWIAVVSCLAWSVAQSVFTPKGVDLNFYNSLLITAFVVNILLLVMSSFKSIEHAGLLVLPITLVSVTLGLGSHQVSTTPSMNPGMQAHIITSMVAFSILGLAAVQSILLFFQERSLHNHSSIFLLRSLPSLHETETLLFQFISTGMVILTLSLGTGFIFIEDIFAQHLAHKTTLSCLAWLVFLTLIVGRARFGWRGQTAIKWSLGGFSFLILAYYGSKFVLELILSNP